MFGVYTDIRFSQACKFRSNMTSQCIFCVAVDLFGTGHVNLKLVMPLNQHSVLFKFITLPWAPYLETATFHDKFVHDILAYLGH